MASTMIDDDDDSFLYGDSKDVLEVAKPPVTTSVPQPISLEQTRSATQGLVAHLEAEAAESSNGTAAPESIEDAQNDEEGEGEEEEEEEEESDDDIEIIMEPTARTLDLRQGNRPPPNRPASHNTPTRAPQPQHPQPSLTTEYTPRERGGVTKLSSTPQPTSTTPSPALSATPGAASSQQKAEDEQQPADSGPDPSTLPLAKAPPSHPSINPDAPGTLDGRSILEVDLNALAEKPWRRPGSDLSDWFNYGFDEISWEAYCYRRRELGDVASVLKNNVLAFAGMPEEQLSALPPEIRTMVIAGAMMASGGAANGGGMMPGAGMNMNGGAMMNQMMNMAPMMNPMMQDMGMAGMEMGMGGPGMGGPGMGGPGMGGPGMGGPGMGGPGMGGAGMGGAGPGPGMMQDAGGPGVMGGGPQGAGQNTQEGQMGMGEGFVAGGGGPGPGMMGMGPEFGMQQQDAAGMGQQQMYQVMENNTPQAPAPTPSRNGPTPGQFRGRAIPPTMPSRARGGYAPRGRGIPVRPASPLPPNVPTGPRNKNKYKDIDGSAPAVDGLDYGGGGGKEGGSRTPDEDNRSSSRKRRSSPGLDDSRSSKRR